MQRIRITRQIAMLGLALIAASAVVGVSAVSVSASGHEFIASVSGKVIDKSSGAQTFDTSAGTIECSSASGTGETVAGKSTTNKETITYSGCFGFGVGISFSPVHYEFNANGPTKIEKVVTLRPEGQACTVTIPAQTVESISYADSSGKVIATASVSGIHSHGNGGTCGTEEETDGSYSGTIKAELEGGTIEWK